MTGEDRLVVLLALIVAVAVFLGAITARDSAVRIFGLFIGGIIAWGGVFYAFAAISAGAAR